MSGFAEPKVDGLTLYRFPILLLALAFATPVAASFVGTVATVQKSLIAMLFLVGTAESLLLEAAHAKHLLNPGRAAQGKRVLVFSSWWHMLQWTTFVAGLTASILSFVL